MLWNLHATVESATIKIPDDLGHATSTGPKEPSDEAAATIGHVTDRPKGNAPTDRQVATWLKRKKHRQKTRQRKNSLN
jgi:hypothetical protein